MTEEEVLAETRGFNAQLERLLADQPKLHEQPPEVTRRLRREGRTVFAPPVFLDRARTETVPGRVGPIPLRIVEPEQESRGAYLHLHGGGWVLGAADLQDPLLEEIADGTGLTAVSVDYRLAPEHPFPAGPDDCEDTALWLLGQSAGRFVIGGESAGAHLAALTLLRLRERGQQGFHAANLVFGVYDAAGTPSRHLWGDRELLLSSPMMDWFADCFVPGLSHEDRRDRAISPLFADLHDLPPALFTCGTQDPLLDDTLFMEARWRAAGNEARLSLYREALHGFTAFPIEAARRSRAEQVDFIRGAAPDV